MISIVNIGGLDPNPQGERTYEVRINEQVITTFKHVRADGLAACLLLASRAVAKKTGQDGVALLEKLMKDTKP